MKAIRWMCVLGLAAAAQAVEIKPAASASAGAGEDQAGSQAVIVTVEADESGATSRNVKVIRLGADGAVVEDGGDAQVMVMPGAAAGAAAGDKEIRVLTRLAAPVDPNRGWLGVALGQTIEKDGEVKPVDSGVVVLNVVKESPAEAAGLLKDDIITAVNGAAVTDGVAGLSKAIGEIGAGGEARLTVLRNGQAQELTATLASPKAGSIQWLHTPDVTLRSKIRLQPHIGMLTPEGNMQFFDAEAFDGTNGLPDAIAEMINRGTSMKMSVRDGERVMELTNNDNGNIVEIRQEGDGPITVKRYAEGSDDVAEQEYADANALAAGDADAFALYNEQASRSANVWTSNDGNVFTFDFEDAAVAEEIHKQLLDEFEEHGLPADSLGDVHEWLMKGFHNAPMMFHPQGGGHGFGFVSKATRTFKVTPEGQIELTVRKGDSEIVKVFKDEADLEARDAEAFTKYQDVMNADIEE